MKPFSGRISAATLSNTSSECSIYFQDKAAGFHTPSLTLRREAILQLPVSEQNSSKTESRCATMFRSIKSKSPVCKNYLTFTRIIFLNKREQREHKGKAKTSHVDIFQMENFECFLFFNIELYIISWKIKIKSKKMFLSANKKWICFLQNIFQAFPSWKSLEFGGKRGFKRS